MLCRNEQQDHSSAWSSRKQDTFVVIFVTVWYDMVSAFSTQFSALGTQLYTQLSNAQLSSSQLSFSALYPPSSQLAVLRFPSPQLFLALSSSSSALSSQLSKLQLSALSSQLSAFHHLSSRRFALSVLSVQLSALKHSAFSSQGSKLSFPSS